MTPDEQVAALTRIADRLLSYPVLGRDALMSGPEFAEAIRSSLAAAGLVIAPAQDAADGRALRLLREAAGDSADVILRFTDRPRWCIEARDIARQRFSGALWADTFAAAADAAREALADRG